MLRFTDWLIYLLSLTWHLTDVLTTCVAAKLGRRSRKMREMIRNIEDTQTEQALHGLLSLNADSNNSRSTSPAISPSMLSSLVLPVSMATMGVTSSTVGLPTSSSASPTSLALTDPVSQSSMAALSMLLKQRSSMGQLIGQPMVAADPRLQALHQSTTHTNGRAVELRPAEDSRCEDEKPLMLKVERMPHREASPSQQSPPSPDHRLPPSSSPHCSSPSSSSAAVTLMSMVAGTSAGRSHSHRESVVGSMLRSPPQLHYTLAGPQFLIKTEGGQPTPQILIKNEAGSSSETVISTSMLPTTTTLASGTGKHHRLPPMAQLPLPMHAQPSVIVQNATLDLRKKSDEQISRSPIKKRPYIPSSMSDDEEGEGGAGGDSSPKVLPEVPQSKQRRMMHLDHQEPSQSSDVFSGVRSADSYSGRHDMMKEVLRPVSSQSDSHMPSPLSTTVMRSKAPASSSSSSSTMSIAKKHEEEAKLTVPYMISRLHESYNATFTFLKVRLGEMKQKLRDYHHQNTMERMIGRIISENLTPPENVVSVSDLHTQTHMLTHAHAHMHTHTYTHAHTHTCTHTHMLPLPPNTHTHTHTHTQTCIILPAIFLHDSQLGEHFGQLFHVWPEMIESGETYWQGFQTDLSTWSILSATLVQDNQIGETCWQGFQMRLNRTIQDVVHFAKKLPGFAALDQDDQISLIKGGCFEVCAHLVWRWWWW